MFSHGFLKVASVSPNIKAGDPFYNVKQIISSLEEVSPKASFACFPELTVTGYSIGDLVFQSYLYDASIEAIKYLLKNNPFKGVIILGSIYKYNDIMYNCSFVIQKNKILGIVPKVFLPHSKEFSEARWFNSGSTIINDIDYCNFLGDKVPFGKIIFTEKTENIKFGVEICADLWAPISPHEDLYANGAMIIFNSSASNDYVGKEELRRLLTKSASYKWNGAYVYSSTSASESTSEVVFSGHKIIASNGEIINESSSFSSNDEIIYGDIDISYLHYERVNNSWFKQAQDLLRDSSFKEVYYKLDEALDFEFEQKIDLHPFVPKTNDGFKRIIDIQAASLYKRLDYIKTNKVVIGISGGLDSTLALLSTCYAFDKYQLNRKNIIGVTMPTSNTSQQTLRIAHELMKKLNITSRTINIDQDVIRALDNIEHNRETKDTTYENVQARYRTYLLMNIANLNQAIVIGTADMSEIALGWSTFNGDHMAMYGLNSGLTKTVVRKTVKYYKDIYPEISDLLEEVLSLVISPELTSENQKTEDIIGKYTINDFILFRFLHNGDSPERIRYLLIKFFTLSEEEADKYVNNFYKRFFSQQFKRLTMPEGVKVLNISLSPRTEVKLNGDIYFLDK